MKNAAWPLPSESSQSHVGERIKPAIATPRDVRSSLGATGAPVRRGAKVHNAEEKI